MANISKRKEKPKKVAMMSESALSAELERASPKNQAKIRAELAKRQALKVQKA